MSKKIKIAIDISIIIIVIVIAIISSFFIIRHLKNKQKVDNVIEIYSSNNVQNRLDNTTVSNIMLSDDNGKIVGTIKIDKISFEGIIYEGTSLDTLSKGVGHFEESAFFEGNVCLAAHNYDKWWAKLHTLKIGNIIKYTCFLGTKAYKVTSIKEIDETDLSVLESSDENIITLITCIKGKPQKRLCVVAEEIK